MFKGIITPIVTPFKRDCDQSINFEATEKLIDHLIEKGINGIFILGSNGEFHVLTEEEKVEFAAFVIKYVNKRVPVFAGTGACSTKAAIELSKKMEALGADALSVITPFFIKPNDDEIYDYFREIAVSVKIPIVLYNIPKCTGCNISKDTLTNLSSIDNIRGIKDSSGDIENLKAYIEAARGTNINVLVGSDSKISEGYALGATGAIAGTSNLITDTLVKLYSALENNEAETADKLQKDIDVLRRALKLGTVPAILKRSIELAGISPVGPARKPVRETAKETDIAIKDMLSYYGL